MRNIVFSGSSMMKRMLAGAVACAGVLLVVLPGQAAGVRLATLEDFLTTIQGRLFYETVRPVMWVGRRFTHGLDLETSLLQRHHVIDHLLDEAIQAGRVGQVVELAAGLSGRGLRFARRYRRRGLTVVEGDLPGMEAHMAFLNTRCRQGLDGRQVLG